MEGARNTYIAEYKAASQELVKHYNSATTEAAAKAAAAQIHAATERQKSAAEALNEAMQNLDPNNQKDGKIIENAFSEMQAANDDVSEAQLKSWESQSASALAETSRDLQKQQTTLETQSACTFFRRSAKSGSVDRSGSFQ
jgi:threonyl-tRNA synthetase